MDLVGLGNRYIRLYHEGEEGGLGKAAEGSRGLG